MTSQVRAYDLSKLSELLALPSADEKPGTMVPSRSGKIDHRHYSKMLDVHPRPLLSLPMYSLGLKQGLRVPPWPNFAISRAKR
jgi:hypothetical protein